MLVSIIIITLNEVENLEETITAVIEASQIDPGYSIPIEIIVSDGGSTDGTIELAKKLADKVVIGRPSRYNQLNDGAKLARGDILLFLHADTLLPKNAFINIINYMEGTSKIGGGFTKKWNWNPKLKRTRLLKFLNYLWEEMGNWLVRFFKSFPGDNAIFVRKSVFEELNGFKPLWICEDFDFSHRLKRYGRRKIICITSAVLTSTRRFEKYGFIRIILIWFFIYWLWRFGMSQGRLKVRFNKYSTIPEKGNVSYMRF
ncbi:MAG: glycosyltransferase family 2 protein [Promethearchaeota archaeon]